jgi:CMP-N-acetylneuraminic acid synthetase
MNSGLSNYTIIIPARKNSRGLPFKNRKLIDNTLDSIPERFHKKIIISTDDDFLKNKYSNYNIFNRSIESASDTASTKSLMLEMVNYIETENIIMLYLTYPERTWKDIEKAITFFENNNASSLLCKKDLKSSPFLMMYEDGINGSQIIEHDLYRRQDYPKCFEISHFVSIFSKKELDKLNNNMYNVNTIFHKINDVVDVDTQEDLRIYNEKNKNNC